MMLASAASQPSTFQGNWHAGTARLLMIVFFPLFSRILYCKVVQTLAAQEAPPDDF